MHEINSGRNDFSRVAELVHHRSLIKDIETNCYVRGEPDFVNRCVRIGATARDESVALVELRE